MDISTPLGVFLISSALAVLILCIAVQAVSGTVLSVALLGFVALNAGDLLPKIQMGSPRLGRSE